MTEVNVLHGGADNEFKQCFTQCPYCQYFLIGVAMGALFRSEEMALCQLFIQPEAAYSSVSMLGETGIVQFRDLNADVSVYLRKFVSEVRRCDELERKLRYIEAEVRKDVVGVPELRIVPKAPNPREIIDLEAHLEKVENEIVELSQNAVNLKSNYVELVELKHVLQRTQLFLTEEEADNTRAALIGDERGQLGFVAGVIQRERVHSFERMLWRISRGNVFIRQAELDDPIEDPATGNLVFKTVFVAFFQGENLKSRIKKVCTGFHASIYPCPDTAAERRDMVDSISRRLEDLKLVLNQTHDHRYRVLTEVAKSLHKWGVQVRKMKAIYHTLNMFNMDVTKKCLIGECWVPVADLNVVRQALADGGIAVGSTIPSFVNVIETLEDPPTFNRTNKFTAGFQTLIDAYGVASYREANPALYTIITFPFLFAIMFGDLGHGIILTCFALYMILDEKRHLNKRGSSEIWVIFFGGRYVILLMGLFSIYTGFIYNDIFSMSMNVFGSHWNTIRYQRVNFTQEHGFALDPAYDYAGSPYIFGMDPIWQGAENKILFLNSFKMKMSVTIAVIHMTFGVCVSIINLIHFKNYMGLLLEFLPQVLFLLVLFGYMVLLIIMKWIMYFASNEHADLKWSQGCAPSVLVAFINMMLFGHVTPADGCEEYMFASQPNVQVVLLLIAVLCIPVMLFGKPLYIKFSKKDGAHEHKATSNGNLNQAMELQPVDPELGNGDTAALAAAAAASAAAASAAAKNHEEEHDFGELMVHQAIHTIEYVLSTVSHTASYLRLWALSLAHAQLSEVLWNMVMRFAFVSDSPVGAIYTYIVFGAWAFFTLAILVMMEGLSAFLHTLRLHWVEFMSKFYAGAGYAFEPFSFKNILYAADDDDN